MSHTHIDFHPFTPSPRYRAERNPVTTQIKKGVQLLTAICWSSVLLTSAVASAAADAQSMNVQGGGADPSSPSLQQAGGSRVAPSACTFSFTFNPPGPVSTSAAGGSASILLNTQAGCPWTASSNVPWAPLAANSSSGTGTSQVVFDFQANKTGQTRTGSVTIAGTTINLTQPSLPAAWSITSTHVGNFTQGQTNAVYTITVTNTGTGATTAPSIAQFFDTLPASMTAVSIQGAGWFCQIAGAMIGCNRSDALAAGTSYPVLTLTVNVAADAPANVTNRVSIAGAGGGSANGSDPTTILSSGTPAWTVTSTHAGNFKQGQNSAVYTITVTNSGTAPTTAPSIAQFFDTLPAGMTPVSIQGAGWLCQIGALIGCNRSDALAPGASYPVLTLTVNVASDATANVTNQVSITGAGAGFATGSDPTTILSSGTPAWTITMNHNGNFVQGQSGFVYTINVINSGNAITSGGPVQVVDNLPTGLIAVAMQGSGWNCQLSTLTCMLSQPITAGSSYPAITLTVSVAANAPSPVTNTATVSGSNAGTATTSDPTTILMTNLTITNGSLPSATVQIAYSSQLTVNGGTAPFTFGILSGSLPPGLNLSLSGLISGTPSQAGIMSFTVQVKDANGTAGQQAFTLTVATKAQAPVITSVLNGASFAQGTPIVSGSWVSIFGTALAPEGTSRAWNTSTEILNGKFPLSLDGTSVTVNGKPAAVEYIQPTQVNIQVPSDAAVGPVQVIVTTPAGASNTFTVNLAQFAPGLFAATQPYIIAQHADGSYVSSSSPARPGEVIILWGTGFGPSDPAVTAGQVYSGASKLANSVSATIGGQSAIVDFAGIVGAGLVQINVHVPTNISGGDVAVVTSIGGAFSQATGNLLPVKN